MHIHTCEGRSGVPCGQYLDRALGNFSPICGRGCKEIPYHINLVTTLIHVLHQNDQFEEVETRYIVTCNVIMQLVMTSVIAERQVAKKKAQLKSKLLHLRSIIATLVQIV